MFLFNQLVPTDTNIVFLVWWDKYYAHFACSHH